MPSDSSRDLCIRWLEVTKNNLSKRVTFSLTIPKRARSQNCQAVDFFSAFLAGANGRERENKRLGYLKSIKSPLGSGLELPSKFRPFVFRSGGRWNPRDPGSPSENGFMEPKYLSEEEIVHPNHHLTRWARIPRGRMIVFFSEISRGFPFHSHFFCFRVRSVVWRSFLIHLTPKSPPSHARMGMQSANLRQYLARWWFQMKMVCSP